MVGLTHYLVLSAAIFSLGVLTMCIKRNAIGILIGVELVLNAANINLVAFNRYLHPQQPWGQGFAIFVIALAAAEAVVGLALVLTIYRNFKTVLSEDLTLLRG